MKKTCHPIGRVLTILFTLACLGTIFPAWTSTGFSYLDPMKKLIQGIKTYGFGTMMGETDNLVFFLSFALLILAALITVAVTAKGGRGAGTWLFLAALFAFCVILYGVKWSLPDLTPAAWLCPALAAAALICSWIAKRPAAAETAEGGYGAGTAETAVWSCPRCGTILADQERFCPNCGSPRSLPENPAAPRRCIACGAALRPNAAFCPNCGRLLEKPAPAAKPRCIACGAVLEPCMIFCPDCGTPVGGKPQDGKREETAQETPTELETAAAAPAGGETEF